MKNKMSEITEWDECLLQISHGHFFLSLGPTCMHRMAQQGPIVMSFPLALFCLSLNRLWEKGTAVYLLTRLLINCPIRSSKRDWALVYQLFKLHHVRNESHHQKDYMKMGKFIKFGYVTICIVTRLLWTVKGRPDSIQMSLIQWWHPPNPYEVSDFWKPSTWLQPNETTSNLVN